MPRLENSPAKRYTGNIKRDGEAMKRIDAYRHILWDFNGTLIDDLDIGVEIQRVMLAERGLPELTRERYLATFDFPIRSWYEYLGYDVSAYAQLAAVWTARYEARALSCGLVPGAGELLKEIHGMGVCQSILSAANREQLLFLTDALGIRGYFTHIYGLDNSLAHGKAQLCGRILEETGCPGEEMLLIGDTTQDYQTAYALGCDCALVACGHQSMQRLKEKAPGVFADFAALRRTLMD